MPLSRRDVSSLAKSGSAKLTGDVTLSQGTNITLTQLGQDISIAASGGSGTFAITQVEVDFGSTDTDQIVVVITDASITSGMKIIMELASNTPTGKDQDETEFAQFAITTVAGTGDFTAQIDSLNGPVVGNFKFNYTYA